MSTSHRVAAAAVVAVPPVITLAFISGGPALQLGLIGLAALAVGAYVGLRHPLYLYRALAVSLGAVPFGYVPGTGAPLTFALGIAVLLAALIHRSAVRRVSALESGVLLLVVTSALSVLITGSAAADATQFLKWVVATLVAVALLRLPRLELDRFGRIFVCSASAAAAFAILILAVDPGGRLISILSPIGYGKETDSSRFVYSGDSKTLRLAGTFIDPNAAGIFLFVALLLCIYLMRGRIRWILTLLLFTALTLTLSRAALFSVVVGVILMFAFQNLSSRERIGILAGFAVALVGAILTPSVRSRVFSSFGSNDAGSSARGDALTDFPGQMQGHWFFGLGWGRPEFTDPATAFEVNFVANSPLLSVYRGGIFTGLAFMLILVVGCVMGYRCLRSSRWEYGFVGGGFIGFSVIALQLDFPVVAQPSVTTAFSVLIVFLIAAWEKAGCTRSNAPLPHAAKTIDAGATTISYHLV